MCHLYNNNWPTCPNPNPLSHRIPQVAHIPLPSLKIKFYNILIYFILGNTIEKVIPILICWHLSLYAMTFSLNKIFLQNFSLDTWKKLTWNYFSLFLVIQLTIFNNWGLDEFTQNFQNNIRSQVTLTNLVHNKLGIKEKVTDFIGRYQTLYSQISYSLLDANIQTIFIGNLQLHITDNILLMKYPSFIHFVNINSKLVNIKVLHI